MIAVYSIVPEMVGFGWVTVKEGAREVGVDAGHSPKSSHSTALSPYDPALELKQNLRQMESTYRLKLVSPVGPLPPETQ